MLALDGVSASYGPYKALFDISFSVPAGGITALLGSNGAGKSTVARVITGLVQATTGSVAVAGHDITRVAPHKIARMGVAHVPEGHGVFDKLTVDEQLTLSFRTTVGRKHVGDALERAYAAFPVLASRRRQTGGTLSGGQQRMLSLARVLAVPPKLLIGDELSLGLAPIMVESVYDGLRRIRDLGCTIVIVEQQLNYVLDLADAAVLLSKGAVAWQGPASQAGAVSEELFGGIDAFHPSSPG
jgi:branched-chain amino acid transport system ATP-binding protein